MPLARPLTSMSTLFSPAVTGKDFSKTWRPVGVLGPFDHTQVLQSAQPRGEDVAWGAGLGGDLAEPGYAEEQFADHQQ